MGETIAAIVGMLLALYGLTDLIIRLAHRLLFGNCHIRREVVVPLAGDTIDTEYLSYCIGAERLLCVGKPALPLIIDEGLGDEAKAEVRRWAAKTGLPFFDREELAQILKEGLQTNKNSVY